MTNQDPEPKVLRSRDFKFNGLDDLVPGSRYTEIKDVEGLGGFGLYFMEPGSQTTTFSLESEDDGTADEYYGPCFEFYFLISGEILTGEDGKRAKEHAPPSASNNSTLTCSSGSDSSWVNSC